MSDAPETIWTAPTKGPCHVGFSSPSLNYTIEYRLKSLPPTPEQLMADHRVQALVEAVNEVSLMAYGYDHLYETTFHRDVHEALSTALAAFKETGE